MRICKAPDEFLVKLYQWSCADFRREIEEGFPLLRGVESSTSYRIIGLMESMPKSKQLAVASFLLKRTHQRAVEILGEKEATDEYGFMKQREKSYQVIYPLAQERFQRASTLGPLLKGKEKVAVVRRVRGELHEPYCVWPQTGFYSGTSFVAEKGEFWIITRLYPDFKGTTFSYDHVILDKGKECYEENMTFYCDRFSLYSWLGISQGETGWSDLRVGDTDQVASHIVRLSQHFIDGVSSLLSSSSKHWPC